MGEQSFSLNWLSMAWFSSFYNHFTRVKDTRKCVYETLCPQLVRHFQDLKMSGKNDYVQIVKKVTKLIRGVYPNHMHIF